MTVSRPVHSVLLCVSETAIPKCVVELSLLNDGPVTLVIENRTDLQEKNL